MALATRIALPHEGQVGNRAKRVSHRLPPSDAADLGATGHRPVTRARREESRRAAEIGEACERTEVRPHVAEGILPLARGTAAALVTQFDASPDHALMNGSW